MVIIVCGQRPVICSTHTQRELTKNGSALYASASRSTWSFPSCLRFLCHKRRRGLKRRQYRDIRCRRRVNGRDGLQAGNGLYTPNQRCNIYPKQIYTRGEYARLPAFNGNCKSRSGTLQGSCKLILNPPKRAKFLKRSIYFLKPRDAIHFSYLKTASTPLLKGNRGGYKESINLPNSAGTFGRPLSSYDR